MRNEKDESINTGVALHLRMLGAADEARIAQPVRAHTPPGFQEPTAYSQQSTVRGLVAPLKTSKLPNLFGADGKLRRTPSARLAAETVFLSDAIVANSRVAEAGAVVTVYEAPTVAIALGQGASDAVLLSRPKEFRVVKSAPFATVADDSEVATTPELPVAVAEIDWSSSIAKAVRFEVPRSVSRGVDPELLQAEFIAALTLGVARAVDEVTCAAILATTPTAFSLAQVASEDLRFDSLGALVGRNAAGASVTQDGKLRVTGVPAEFTTDMEETIIGAWNRAAVVVGDEIAIHFDKTKKNGELSVTAWINMLAVVAEPAKFWTVS